MGPELLASQSNSMKILVLLRREKREILSWSLKRNLSNKTDDDLRDWIL